MIANFYCRIMNNMMYTAVYDHILLYMMLLWIYFILLTSISTELWNWHKVSHRISNLKGRKKKRKRMKKKIKHSETVVHDALMSSGSIPTCRYVDTIIFKYKFNRKGLWEYFYTLRSVRRDRSILYWIYIYMYV